MLWRVVSVTPGACSCFKLRSNKNCGLHTISNSKLNISNLKRKTITFIIWYVHCSPHEWICCCLTWKPWMALRFFWSYTEIETARNKFAFMILLILQFHCALAIYRWAFWFAFYFMKTNCYFYAILMPSNEITLKITFLLSPSRSSARTTKWKNFCFHFAPISLQTIY